jgi:hypothetical protein
MFAICLTHCVVLLCAVLSHVVFFVCFKHHLLELWVDFQCWSDCLSKHGFVSFAVVVCVKVVVIVFAICCASCRLGFEVVACPCSSKALC